MALPKTTAARVHLMASGLHHENCCGMTEYSGMWRIRSAGDAVAVRKAAYASGNRGVVFATVANCTRSHSGLGVRCAAYDQTQFLKRAGFRSVKRFKNPRTNSDISVWMADSIKNNIRIPDEVIIRQEAYQQPVPAPDD